MATVFMEVEEAVAANTTIDNVFTGKRFERAPFDGNLDLALTGSAVGLEYELNVGGRSANPRVPAGALNRSPLVPDDLKVRDVEVDQGELIQLTVANTTGAPLTIRARVIIEEEVFEEVMG